MTIYFLILNIILSCGIMVTSFMKKDNIRTGMNRIERILSSTGAISSILMIISYFYQPESAAASIIYALSMTGVLAGSFVPSVLSATRFSSNEYSENKKFRGLCIATWVLAVLNIVALIVPNV